MAELNQANTNPQPVNGNYGQLHNNGGLIAANVIRFIFGFIAIMLGLRFILRLTAANPINSFVHIVYSISGIFSAPFDSIFGVAAIQARTVAQSVFEPSTLVAIAVYALIAWGLAKLLTLNRPR